MEHESVRRCRRAVRDVDLHPPTVRPLEFDTAILRRGRRFDGDGRRCCGRMCRVSRDAKFPIGGGGGVDPDAVIKHGDRAAAVPARDLGETALKVPPRLARVGEIAGQPETLFDGGFRSGLS